MSGIWDFFKGKRSEPAPPAEETAPPPNPYAGPPSPAPSPVLPSYPAPELEAIDVESLDLTPRVLDALKLALQQGAHGMLYDPEEFSCVVCTIGNGQVAPIGECSLEGYQSSRDQLLSLDSRRLKLGDTEVACRIYHAVTDLGQRVILQFFPTDWDEELMVERRKGNVRLLNRVRPGTSLSRHNRETLLGALKRAGQRPPPSFLERLDREGLVPQSSDDGRTEQERLEQLLRKEALPRKAVARVLGEYLGVPFVDVEEHLPRRDVAQRFTHKQVLTWEAIPCAEEDGTIVVAVADPTDAETKAAIERHLGCPVAWKVAAATDIRVAAEKTYKSD